MLARVLFSFDGIVILGNRRNRVIKALLGAKEKNKQKLTAGIYRRRKEGIKKASQLNIYAILTTTYDTRKIAVIPDHSSGEAC